MKNNKNIVNNNIRNILKIKILIVALGIGFNSFAAQSNLPSAMTEASGTTLSRTTNYTWDSNLRVPTSVTVPVPDLSGVITNRAINYTYVSGKSLVSQITVSAPVIGGVESRSYNMTYDSTGQLLTLQGPRFNSTFNEILIFTYNLGRITTVTNGLNQTVTFSNWNSYGKPQNLVDENGMRYSMTYDLRNRLTSIINKGNISNTNFETTSYTYDSVGQIIKMTAPTGFYKTFVYDTAHRLNQINEYDESANYLGKMVFTLDAMSNTTGVTIYNSSNTIIRNATAQYDNQNRLKKTIDSLNNSYTVTLDGNGNTTNILDPNNKNVSMTIDALNRITSTTLQDSTVINMAYDIADRLTTVTDSKSLNTNYKYNGFDDMLQVNSPDTGITNMNYDKDSNMLSSTDARNITSNYSYDELNRLKSITYPTASENVSLTYDNCVTSTNMVGKLCQINDESGSTVLLYNNKGKIGSKLITMNGINFTTNYNYDINGQLISITYPSGKIINYNYNNGKVSGISYNNGTTTTNVISQVKYDSFSSRFTSFTFGNSTVGSPNVYNRTFNNDGKITAISSIADAVNKTYTFDSRYNITGINGITNNTATYDDRSRLTKYTATDSRSYTYNSSSDRLNDTLNALPANNYSYDSMSHHLTSVGNIGNATYDAVGNILTFGGITYKYKNSNRMNSATNTTNSTNYKYNALGQRVMKIQGSNITYYIYEEGQLLGEYSATGTTINPIQEHIYLNGVTIGLLKTTNTTNLYNVYVDHLNTPRTILDLSNNPMWIWKNDDAFGNNLPNETISGSTFTYNLRFPGQYFDKESKLSYNYYRDYNSAIGRYMQSDPIGLGGGINTYVYVDGNPLGDIDPMGLYDGQDFLNDSTDWGAGFGDNLTFGLTSVSRNAFNIGSVDNNSNMYNGGNLGGISASILIGSIAGLKSTVYAGPKSVDWSHWIPDRYIRKYTGMRNGKSSSNLNLEYRSCLDVPVIRDFINSSANGNYVSKLMHQLSDPKAYRFKSNKVPGENFGLLRSQINRLPYWFSYGLYGASSYIFNKE